MNWLNGRTLVLFIFIPSLSYSLSPLTLIESGRYDNDGIMDERSLSSLRVQSRFIGTPRKRSTRMIERNSQMNEPDIRLTQPKTLPRSIYYYGDNQQLSRASGRFTSKVHAFPTHRIPPKEETNISAPPVYDPKRHHRDKLFSDEQIMIEAASVAKSLERTTMKVRIFNDIDVMKTTPIPKKNNKKIHPPSINIPHQPSSSPSINNSHIIPSSPSHSTSLSPPSTSKRLPSSLQQSPMASPQHNPIRVHPHPMVQSQVGSLIRHPPPLIVPTPSIPQQGQFIGSIPPPLLPQQQSSINTIPQGLQPNPSSSPQSFINPPSIQNGLIPNQSIPQGLINTSQPQVILGNQVPPQGLINNQPPPPLPQQAILPPPPTVINSQAPNASLEQLGCGWDIISNSCKDVFNIGWCIQCHDFGNIFVHNCKCVQPLINVQALVAGNVQ